MASTATPSKPGVDRKQRFVDSWPRIRDELVGHFRSLKLSPDAVEYYAKNLDYNVPHGKLNRGLSVVDTAEILLGKTLDDEQYYKAAVLGWGVELLQAFFLVADDMMDSSITRRGQPCWYKLPEKHFRAHPAYVDLLELFHDTTLQTEFGQLIDLLTAVEGVVDLDKFSLEKHSQIVIFKTAYYSFYLPVALAMRFTGVTDPAAYEQAQKILIPLGEYFQVQDDFLDCYGTPEQIGKIGTDIVDNKCSWLINVALSLAGPEDRAVLDANYGRKDPAAEQRIKDTYVKLGVQIKYKEYEEESYRRVCALIEQVDEKPATTGGVALKRDVFHAFLNKIYRRTK
ncbi:terpenoid synthase [Auriculariales sp. MPI-PUGE-AT-0066]|nr:terpenoid synthase [Auriculariales sp. MPI-PUGE-AT-0066]